MIAGEASDPGGRGEAPGCDDDRPASTRHLQSPVCPPEPIAWPEGVRAAACLTFDLDAEAGVLGPSPGAVDRMSPMSHQSYGPLVGVPRILSLLDRHGVRATFFVPGYSADRYPSTVRDIVAAGHEVAHHSYFHENTIGMDRQTEADMIDEGLRALEEAAGVRPVGYRAPMWEMNYHTPELLAERGFLYDSSLMDSDHPYELAVGGTQLVEIPASWALDDWEQYAYLPSLIGSGVIESPRKALEMWVLELEAIHRLGASFTLCCHPFLSGRPSRAEALGDLLTHMRQLDGLWVTALEDVALHVRSLRLEPRPCPKPPLPDVYWVDPR